MPELWQYESGQDECGPKDLRIYRDAVLESGENSGDSGTGAASVGYNGHHFSCSGAFLLKDEMNPLMDISDNNLMYNSIVKK